MRVSRLWRFRALAATWVVLAIASLGGSQLIHPDQADWHGLDFADHDDADHRFTAVPSPAPFSGGHCDICHLLRSLSSAPACRPASHAVCMRPVRAPLHRAPDRLDSAVSSGVPSRAPPAA